MDTMIAEIRELERRDMALDAEKEWIRKRRREILELNKGTRKSSHDTADGPSSSRMRRGAGDSALSVLRKRPGSSMRIASMMRWKTRA